MFTIDYQTEERDGKISYYLILKSPSDQVPDIIQPIEIRQTKMSDEEFEDFKNKINSVIQATYLIISDTIARFNFNIGNIDLLSKKEEKEKYKIGDLICIEDTKHLGRVVDLAVDNFLKVDLLISMYYSSPPNTYHYNSDIVKPYDKENDICVNTFVKYNNPGDKKYNNQICLVNYYARDSKKYEISTILNERYSMAVERKYLKNINMRYLDYPILAEIKNKDDHMISKYCLVLGCIDEINKNPEYLCHNSGLLRVFKEANLKLNIAPRKDLLKGYCFIDGTGNLKYINCVGRILEIKEDMYKISFGDNVHKYKKDYCKDIETMFYNSLKLISI